MKSVINEGLVLFSYFMLLNFQRFGKLKVDRTNQWSLRDENLRRKGMAKLLGLL